MNGRGVATAAMVTAVMTGVAVLAMMLPTEDPRTVAGRVECRSGRSVTGIWVDAVNGGSSWAQWQPVKGTPSIATFSYDLLFGGRFSIDVGCGGTRVRWASSTSSAVLDTLSPQLVCRDAMTPRRTSNGCQ